VYPYSMWPDAGWSSPATSGGGTDYRRQLLVLIPTITMAEDMGGTGTLVVGTHRDCVLHVGWGRGGQDEKFTGGARSGTTAVAKEDCLTIVGAPGCRRAGSIGGRA
jgi:hypothetical protein